MVELTARVSRIGRASMTVAVEMMAENPGSSRRLAVRGSFEMVAVDDHGKPTPIPTRPQAIKEEMPS